MIRNFLLKRFSTIKKSSYDIQKQYSAYKMKRKFEADKSFKKFNLSPPTSISSSPQQPKFLLADISNLKQYSHTYPQFLLKQLKNSSSKIHSSVSSIFNRLYLMNTQEALEFILFLDKWGFFQEEQIIMIKRWIQNQNFNFEQIWDLLKSNLHLESQLENFIIKYLQIIQPKQYSYLFKSLNYYRLKDLGSEEFFVLIEKHIIRNIQLMTGSQLAQLVSHYANNINQSIESKLNILESVSNRMKIILQHLSANELINVLFCYLKLDLLKQEIGQRIMKRIIQTLPKWKQQQIRQLMEVSTNLGKKQELIIKELVKLFYKDKISAKLLPSLYSLAIQYAVLEKEFVRRIEDKLLDNVSNMTPENVSKSCWAFAVVPRQNYSIKSQSQTANLTDKLFFRKVEEIVEGGLRDYTIKDVTRIVWSLGSKQFKLDAPFWNNIQLWIQQQLYKQTATLRDASLILWAYTNKIPLKQSTVSIIKRMIIQKVSQQGEGFDLAMICWYFSQIKQSNKQILSQTYQKYKEQSDSMQFLETLKCLRWFINEGVAENEVLTKFVKRLSEEYKEKSYFVLLNCLAIITSIKIQDKKLLIQTVLKVDERIKALKQLQTL